MSDAGAPRMTEDQLNALKLRNPVNDVAGQWVKLRRRRKGWFIGPCPICTTKDPQSKTATRFECNDSEWKCVVCPGGGDVIKLIQLREGIGFREAIDRLGGRREEAPTPDLARKAGRAAYQRSEIKADAPPAVPDIYVVADPLRAAFVDGWRKAKSAEDYAENAREAERRRLYDYWKEAAHWRGTPVEFYLTGRGYVVPANARLKYHPRMPLYCDGSDFSKRAHIGGAMLAAIINAAGKFSGLHITWLDPNGPKGKALVLHPETGEALPSKKSRGTKGGGYIDLGGYPTLLPLPCPHADFVGPCAVLGYRRVFAGEGIETVYAVHTALMRAGKVRPGDLFRSGIDLGNLGGKSLDTLSHPTLTTETGRPRRVAGVEPDLDSVAMPVPDSADEVVLLGDGDSDAFTTRNAMTRARLRHERPGRAVRVSFAPDGFDFDDMLNRPAVPSEEMQDA